MKKKLFAIGLVIMFTGCADLTESIVPLGLNLLENSEYANNDDVKSIVNIGKSIIKSTEDITPEQEYYIGRAIAANLLKSYKPYKNKKAHEYINKIGNLLTYQSDIPSTYGGYHFMILNSDEVNAFAAPGGFIFVTRGMLRCTDSEDAVAAVLAHEIAHITQKHGLSSIKSSRWTQVGSLLVTESAKRYTNEEVASLVGVFEDSIDDIINTVVVNGYSREYEYEADKEALRLLNRLGYNSAALIDMLRLMDKRLKPEGLGFAKTHPSPLNRIKEISDGDLKQFKVPKKRQQRYKKILSRI